MHLECLEQKSLIQEIIEATGHMCIFLSKFHWVFLGGQSKSIFAITVIILLPLSKKTSQRHLHLWMWKQSGNRNIRWFDACMHIEMARGQKRYSSRSKPLALTSMHLTCTRESGEVVQWIRKWFVINYHFWLYTPVGQISTHKILITSLVFIYLNIHLTELFAWYK